MASLEDRMLGEKSAGYCSSSDDDGDEYSSGNNVPTDTSAVVANGGNSVPAYNTGPKGVIGDWRRYQQLRCQQRSEADSEMMEIAKRLSLSTNCDKAKETRHAQEQATPSKEQNDEEDEFIAKYMQKRLKEMQLMSSANRNKSSFGQLYDLDSANAYVKAIDVDSNEAIVIIHLCDDGNEYCVAVDQCLRTLANRYKGVKFCRVSAQLLGASTNFCKAGVPAIQAYNRNQLTMNLVRINEILGDSFDADDLLSLMSEYGVFNDAVEPI